MIDLNDLTKQVESRALALLAMREHGDLELIAKLNQKFPELENQPGLVKIVLENCQKQGWQNDERFIEAYVRQALDKGHGPYKIRQALQGKTSHSESLEAALDLGDEDWVELAQAALEKKYGDLDKPKARNEQAKRMRFLQSRGFTQSQIYKAFR